MNKLREQYYYFGRDEEHCYLATPMLSCIVAGRCGAGKTTFLNSLLVRLIQETNPDELSIYYNDFTGEDSHIWSDNIPDNKFIPQLKEVRRFGSMDGVESFEKFGQSLNNLLDIIATRRTDCIREGVENYRDIAKDYGGEEILYIINEYQVYSEFTGNKEWFDTTIGRILSVCDAMGVHLLLLSQSNKNALSDKTILKFPIRIVTPISEDVSNLFIGCNLASMCKEKYGIIWIKNGKYNPYKLYVPFYPDTWIRKFIGYYSIRKQK
jgi:hypothetical protein